MRYMFLVYSRERDFAEASPQEREKVKAGQLLVQLDDSVPHSLAQKLSQA